MLTFEEKPDKNRLADINERIGAKGRASVRNIISILWARSSPHSTVVDVKVLDKAQHIRYNERESLSTVLRRHQDEGS